MTSQKSKTSSLKKMLEYRILHGLSCEWETSLWVLDKSYKRLMKKPTFSLGEFNSKLGYWSSDKNEIRISRNLVFNHPWYSVREVLLHEMAHQLAGQILKGENESPHGPTFHKACRLLRADPKASGQYPTLDEKIFQDKGASDDHRLRKIKKLMALAESKNRHEAEAAMLKAHQLIGKYNIKLFELNEKRFFRSVFLGEPKLRHTRDEYHLAGLLCDYYFVNGIWVSAYVLEKEKIGKVLEITGTVPNIKIAAYVYHFVHHYIDSKWSTYNKNKNLNHHRKTDFSIGIIEGFRHKLESASGVRHMEGHEKSLIKIEDPLLKKYMAYKYPHTTNFYRDAQGQDDQVVHDGVHVGKKMVISKGIDSRTKHNELLKIQG